MYKNTINFAFIFFTSLLLGSSSTMESENMDTKHGNLLVLDEFVEETDLYETFMLLSDNEKEITIDDVVAGKYDGEFTYPNEFETKIGFFEVAKWLKFDLKNEVAEKEWLLEFAFPLIFQIHVYVEADDGIEKIITSGADYPFSKRGLDHRHFVFNLDIKPNETKTYYVLIHGGGDLHPPIKIWEKDSFIAKTQTEFSLLGLFYGVIIIMVLYNLFLYFSLRIRAYLYYVLAISSTMIAQLALNGLGFKYLWPESPNWNVMAVPFWVSIACVFIILFTKEFLDTKLNNPLFEKLIIGLFSLNGLTFIFLFISHYVALNLMLVSTASTFIAVLTVGFISLKRGVREARFFIIGWIVFLVGTSITILERAAVVPYNTFTEYAGQGALSIEVAILSLALADKINIMRKEKYIAEKSARQSQQLALENLKKTDELKDEFLAITSHELRTPLYGMIGIAESLKGGVAGSISNKMSKQLNMIVTSGKRLSHLVNDILDFSQLKHNTIAINLKQVHLSGFVDVVFTICQPLLRNKQLKLVNKIPSDLPAVLADQDRLQQIMYNLIGNAIKYTDVGKVTVTAKHTDDKVEISISDTGKGIDPKIQKDIFEPFEQGDRTLSRDVGGTGIGLSVTKQLVKLHKSELTVKSAVGLGSTFSFNLPLALGNEQTEQVAITLEPFVNVEEQLTTPRSSKTQESIKVLVADDELVNLQVLMNQLTLEGMEVTKVMNGEGALDLVEKHSFDVIILDVMMPGMSGYEVCKQLRETYSLTELPILMLTAKSQVRDKITAFEVGANDYVTKPCDKEELLSRVKTLAQLKWMNDELSTLNVDLETKVIERTKALRVANKDLAKTNKSLVDMAKSRRNLLANIAHELGTPVTLIYSYVQALQGGLVQNDDTYYRNLVDDKIKVLERLIHDLSDLARLEEGRTSLNLQTSDLYTWLDNVYQKFAFDVQALGREFEKKHVLTNNEVLSCSIDVERMDQVFANIISNAVKYTSKETGKISLNVNLNKRRDSVIFAIKDNGTGIKADTLPHIFERFYQQAPDTSKKKTMGTGLGLAIVKEIIQGHHGKVWIDSELNEGTSFYFSLPIKSIS